MANVAAAPQPLCLDFEWSETQSSIMSAIMAVQAEIPSFRKNKVVSVKKKDGSHSHSYKYAPLPHIVQEATPVLHRNGLLIIQPPGTLPGHIVVRTIVFHVPSGEWIRTAFGYPEAGGNLQHGGGAVSFLRRYAYPATLGIVTEDDDDARLFVAREEAGANRKERRPKADPPPPPSPLQKWLQAAGKSGFFACEEDAVIHVREKFGLRLGMDLTEAQLTEALAELRERYKQRKEQPAQSKAPTVGEDDRKRLQSAWFATVKEALRNDLDFAYWIGLDGFGWTRDPGKRENHGVSMGKTAPAAIQDCTRYIKGLDPAQIDSLRDRYNLFLDDQRTETKF